jgi:hypothetical protein
MNQQYQKGEINLVWVAVISALVAAVAMAALYSWRYERNLFAEGWTKLASKFQDTQRAAEAVTGINAPAIYQCNVNGKVLYSNVACDVKNADSKKVDIQDTRGFEAPKVPVPEKTLESAKPTAQDRIIERATQNR